MAEKWGVSRTTIYHPK
nr:hypothetical protein [Bacillus cereus]